MPDLGRRKFLQYSGLVTGMAATFGIATISMGCTKNVADPRAEHTAASNAGHAGMATGKPLSRGKMFFTNALEFATLSAAAERIFPKDELGPGAIELAVPYFIDNQLAGAYGYNAREYTSGPYFTGAPTQGYQTPLLRRDVFKQGLLALNNASQEQFDKTFPELSGADMDKILTDCEGGKIPTQGFTSRFFFMLLRDATLAGAYSDPIYNGNNNMDGWRMKDYPGTQMDYSYLITSDTFEKVEPMSMAGM